MSGFKMETIIGKGQFGTVWSGQWLNPKTGTWEGNVAIKKIDVKQVVDDMMLNAGVGDEKIRKSLIKDLVEKQVEETKILQSLDSPFIVKALAEVWDEDNSTLYIIMNKMPKDGTFLVSQMAEYKQKDNVVSFVRLFAKVMCQLLFALVALDKAGVVHRDIKPANILYDPATDRVQLADFGLACIKNNCTHFSGTPTYMEPGCIKFKRGGRRLRECQDSSAADVFSVGMTLAVILLGKPVMSPKIKSYEDWIAAFEKFKALLTKYAALGSISILIKVVLQMLSPDPSARPKISDLEIFAKKLRSATVQAV